MERNNNSAFYYPLNIFPGYISDKWVSLTARAIVTDNVYVNLITMFGLENFFFLTFVLLWIRNLFLLLDWFKKFEIKIPVRRCQYANKAYVNSFPRDRGKKYYFISCLNYLHAYSWNVYSLASFVHVPWCWPCIFSREL